MLLDWRELPELRGLQRCLEELQRELAAADLAPGVECVREAARLLQQLIEQKTSRPDETLEQDRSGIDYAQRVASMAESGRPSVLQVLDCTTGSPSWVARYSLR